MNYLRWKVGSATALPKTEIALCFPLVVVRAVWLHVTTPLIPFTPSLTPSLPLTPPHSSTLLHTPPQLKHRVAEVSAAIDQLLEVHFSKPSKEWEDSRVDTVLRGRIDTHRIAVRQGIAYTRGRHRGLSRLPSSIQRRAVVRERGAPLVRFWCLRSFIACSAFSMLRPLLDCRPLVRGRHCNRGHQLRPPHPCVCWVRVRTRCTLRACLSDAATTSTLDMTPPPRLCASPSPGALSIGSFILHLQRSQLMSCVRSPALPPLLRATPCCVL